MQLSLALQQPPLENAVFLEGFLQLTNEVSNATRCWWKMQKLPKTSASTFFLILIRYYSSSSQSTSPHFFCFLFRLYGMDNDGVPTTIHDNDSRNVSQMDKETGSSDATTDTPVTKLEPQPGKAFGNVMISHISAPPVHFADGDAGNPRNWAPNRKIAIGAFVIVAGFVA